MTIATSQSTTTLLGDGSTVVFDFAFIAGASTNIVVTLTDASGNETILSPSLYSLVLNAAVPGQLWGVGGTVTYPLTGSPITAGESLTIARIVPLTQTTSISNQGGFYPAVVEQALDQLEMQIQQITARTGQYRGTWQTGVLYNFGDIVVDGANGTNTGNYYICALSNTSVVWATDLAAGDWVLAFNVQTLVSLAAAAAATVLLATSATNNVAIGTGSKTLVTQSGKEFQVGMFLVAADANNPANFMTGQVTAYSGTSLTLNVTSTGGGGTPSAWDIGVSGAPGPQGTQGAPGTLPIAAAGGTANAITATYSPAVGLVDQNLAVVVLAAAATITNPTFSPNGNTAHPITARGGQALVVGDLPGAGFVAFLEYNAANTRWELLNPPTPLITNNQLLANTSGGTAPPAGTGLSAFLDAVFGANRGRVLVRGASAWAEVGPGTNGQALTSNGTDLAMGTPSNQTITLSGDVGGSGSAGIATTLAGIIGAQTVGIGAATKANSFTIDGKGRVNSVSNCTTNCNCGC